MAREGNRLAVLPRTELAQAIVMKACPGLIETVLVNQGFVQGTTYSQSQTKTAQGGINGDDQKQGKENAYAPGDEECGGIHKRRGIERLHIGGRKKRYTLHTVINSHRTS